MQCWIGTVDEGGDIIPPNGHLTIRDWATWIAYNWTAIQRQGLLGFTQDDHRQDLFVLMLSDTEGRLAPWAAICAAWNREVKSMRIDDLYERHIPIEHRNFDLITDLQDFKRIFADDHCRH